MANFKMTRAWFKKALGDYKSARYLMASSDEDVLDRIAVDIQQSVEKSLKGYMVFRGIAAQRWHDLDSLAELLLKSEPNLTIIATHRDIFDIMTRQYKYARYPDSSIDVESLTFEMAEKHLIIVKAIFDELTRLISPDGLLI